jgi:hypothetical protein
MKIISDKLIEKLNIYIHTYSLVISWQLGTLSMDCSHDTLPVRLGVICGELGEG